MPSKIPPLRFQCPMRHSASGIFPLIHLCDKLDTLHGQAVNLHISRHFSPCRINLDPTPNFHFSRAQSKPPDVKSWTTFFTIFYFRSASTSRRKSLIFLDIPPFFSLAVYFFALIFIFIAEDLGSSPFSIIKESSFNLFLCCVISLQDSI